MALNALYTLIFSYPNSTKSTQLSQVGRFWGSKKRCVSSKKRSVPSRSLPYAASKNLYKSTKDSIDTSAKQFCWRFTYWNHTNNNRELFVSRVGFNGLKDRFFIARKCATSTVDSFFFTCPQKCHTCFARFLAGRTKATWLPFPSGISPWEEQGISENFWCRLAIASAAARWILKP